MEGRDVWTPYGKSPEVVRAAELLRDSVMSPLLFLHLFSMFVWVDIDPRRKKPTFSLSYTSNFRNQE
jgi:hypothetical protein